MRHARRLSSRTKSLSLRIRAASSISDASDASRYILGVLGSAPSCTRLVLLAVRAIFIPFTSLGDNVTVTISDDRFEMDDFPRSSRLCLSVSALA